MSCRGLLARTRPPSPAPDSCERGARPWDASAGEVMPNRQGIDRLAYLRDQVVLKAIDVTKANLEDPLVQVHATLSLRRASVSCEAVGYVGRTRLLIAQLSGSDAPRLLVCTHSSSRGGQSSLLIGLLAATPDRRLPPVAAATGAAAAGWTPGILEFGGAVPRHFAGLAGGLLGRLRSGSCRGLACRSF
jgi:hypothetical protein